MKKLIAFISLSLGLPVLANAPIELPSDIDLLGNAGFVARIDQEGADVTSFKQGKDKIIIACTSSRLPGPSRKSCKVLVTPFNDKKTVVRIQETQGD